MDTDATDARGDHTGGETMKAHEEGKFEGMVVTRLSGIEDRMDELLEAVHGIEGRCCAEQATTATLAAEVRELREKTNLHMRIIWSAIAWIVVAAAGMLLATFGGAR